MTQTSQKKKIESLVNDLHSTHSERVLKALKRIPEEGNATMVQPLLRTYLAWPNDEAIRAEVEKILGELKTRDAIPHLINALDEKEFDSIRGLIISVFWHAGIYPSDELDVLIRHAIRGDYSVALEVVTVLENTDEFTDPDMAQQHMLDIDDYLDRHPDAEHAPILDQLKQVLKEQYNL
jgi:hypothetical protein